ncbi:MDR family MFS transporter [Actinoallomurus sp. NPDC050550]|uniref:MDR family MFS transporter n=1 Tax=Actinoallomurus sp. NPDC050550 TaxID=3154937 RepID=UPI0033C0A28B
MSATPTPARERLDPAFVRLALVLLVGVLAVVFDTTIVNVALDTLGGELHATVSTIQWVTTGYLLALGMAVPVTGWLVDRWGGKNVWLSALAIFLAGSVGASLAWNAPALIACRIVQGAGGGLMLPVLQTLLFQAAGGRSLGRVTALISFPALLGPILGPMAGGLIVRHLGWRWIFWVNVPFCLVGLVLAWRLMPDFPATRRSRLDGVGLALLSPGIAAVVYGLAQVGRDGGFGHASVLVPMAAGAALITVFAVRASVVGDDALVDVRLFRVTSFSAAGGLLFLSGFALYGAMLLVPLYFQQVRGQDAFTAGLLIAAQGVGALVSRGPAGVLTDRIGPRWVAFAGLVLVAAATVPFAFVTTGTREWWLVAALVVRGVGLSAVTGPVMAGAYLGLDRAAVPHASIITRTAQQVGGSFGTAVLAVVLQRSIAAHADGGPAGRASAFDVAFWWSIGFTAAAIVLALWLPAGSQDA